MLRRRLSVDTLQRPFLRAAARCSAVIVAEGAKVTFVGILIGIVGALALTLVLAGLDFPRMTGKRERTELPTTPELSCRGSRPNAACRHSMVL